MEVEGKGLYSGVWWVESGSEWAMEGLRTSTCG